jgi:NAD(P)-dependent dehydrogenase (short-subunit alcohol dehydrogenase family)
MRTIGQLMSLSGRVAVVTGGAGKIAEAFLEALAELGATLCIFDIAGDAGKQRSYSLTNSFSVEASAFVVDVGQETSVQQAVRTAGEQYGRLDILVNNAAYPPLKLPPDGRELEYQSLQHWQANIEVMLTGSFLMTRACVPWLRRSGNGVVINIGSTYGLVGPDMRLYEGTEMGNESYYAAAKGGIIQLTRYWATTLAPNVRVNCIVPGGVWRQQPDAFHERYKARTPLQRMAVEEDLKGAIAYFGTDLSAYVTGQVLAVDGGWTAW